MAVALIRETWTFSLFGGAETAQVGWHWLVDPAAAWKSDLNDNKDVFWSAVRSKFSNSTEVTQRDAVHKDIGSGATIATFPLDLPTDVAGSSGLDWMPPQCAAVLSLRTALAGRSYRGRVYLPGFSRAAANANGRIDHTVRDLLADKFALYLTTVATDAAGNIPVVYSKTLSLTTQVLEVQCGDVWDTQRRRRDALIEARHSAAV